MKCPICKRDVQPGDPEVPFCSERCRLLELGHWAMEKYVISEPAPAKAGKSEDDDGE